MGFEEGRSTKENMRSCQSAPKALPSLMEEQDSPIPSTASRQRSPETEQTSLPLPDVFQMWVVPLHTPEQRSPLAEMKQSDAAPLLYHIYTIAVNGREHAQ